MSRSPAVILYDSAAHPVGVELDGSIYRLQTQTKLATGHGLATEAKQDVLEASLTSIEGDTDNLDVALSSRASESTADLIRAKTDNLDVALSTRTKPSDLQKTVLHDGSGNPVGIILDGAVYRLQSESKIAKGSSDLVSLDAIDTISGQGRLKATLYSLGGEPIAFTSAPPDPSSIRNSYVLNGSNDSLLVDGSVTPVEFTYEADSTYDISLQEMKLTIASNSITFGNGYFGAVSGPLTNGVLVQITAGGNTGTVINIQQNEGFVNFASPGGFQWVVSSKDLLSTTWLIGGGLRLYAGTSDRVSVTVRDDIDSAGVYFRCFVKGNLLPSV